MGNAIMLNSINENPSLEILDHSSNRNGFLRNMELNNISKLVLTCNEQTSLSYCLGGDYSGPYKEVVINDNNENIASISNSCAYNSTIEKITLNIPHMANIKQWEYFVRECANLEVIDGYPLDLTSNTSCSYAFYSSPKLREVRVAPNSLNLNYTTFYIGISPLLTDESIVSIANGMLTTSPIKNLQWHNNNKTRLQTITGRITDGLFVADSSGTLTLRDFIINTKGWTI